MATTLANLRDRVERILADTSNDIWGTDDVDEAIRLALHEYGKSRPLRENSTVTLDADGREVSLSSLSGLIGVSRVWYPYDSSDPEHPPSYADFEHWRDEQTLYITTGQEPQSGENVRVFYSKSQTLNGLDGASATTFPEEDESIVATGAAGYAATSRAVDLAEQVTIDKDTAGQIRDWGMSRLADFREALKAIARAEALSGDARIPISVLDRHAGGWS